MWTRQLRYWLNSARREEALREEMRAHMEERAAELRAEGMNEQGARAEAHRRFGNMGLAAEESGEIWIARYLRDFAQDIRYAARSFCRMPGFTAVAILSAALGIGTCATVFGIVNFALLRPLPIQDPQLLYSLSGIRHRTGDAGGSLSFPEVRDMREQTRSWNGIAAFWTFVPAGIGERGGARRQWGFLVTANYFDVVRPGFALGRGFSAKDDDTPGAPAKIVLSHNLWRTSFAADPAIVGRTIQVNKRPMTVTGVAAAGFRGTEVAVAPDFYLPFSQIAEVHALQNHESRFTSYDAQWLMSVGRIRPGVEPTAAQAELNVLARSLVARESSLARDRGFHAERAGQLVPGIRRFLAPAFLLLLLVAFLVLLAACANVANLMLARASARSQEIATRLAVGSSRGRLVRQLLAESMLLALSGGALGIALAYWAGRHIGGFRLPLPVPIDFSVELDWRVVLFAAALSIATAIGFGLVPALRASRMQIASLRRFGLRNGLVVAQVGISTVLLILSGLFLRSLGVQSKMSTGMDTRNVLLAPFDPALSRYQGGRAPRFLQEVLRGAESLPGVHSASLSNMPPLSIAGNHTQVRREDQKPGDGTRTAVMAVGPRFFQTLGIPILLGNDLPSAPSPTPVAVVNKALADALFPNQNAVGRSIIDDGRPTRITGVVGNSKYQYMQEDDGHPILYKAIYDAYAEENTLAGVTLFVKTNGPTAPLVEPVRRMLLSLDRELVVSPFRSMETQVTESMFLPRLGASLFGLCGAMGLAIAAIGVYGVISFAVARRRRDIGIRLALGAESSRVVRMVVAHGLWLAAAGTAAGIAAGLALARLAGNVIYGVSATDPITFAAVPIVLLAVAALATIIPARRAAAVNPSETLRAE